MENKNNPTPRSGGPEHKERMPRFSKIRQKLKSRLRRLALPGILVLSVSMLIWLAFSDRGQAQAGGTVTLLFFDRNGAALSPTQVRSISNNAGVGYNSDFLLDPANLRAISSGPLYTSGTNLAFNIPSRPVALAFNWPTLPNGFGLVILDNGGAGFSSGATVNFCYQAARDIRSKLDAAKAARPDYVPSTKFNTAW